jgi:hypothetical protein
MLLIQRNPGPLSDERSERFLEILSLFQLSLQENRAKGALIAECFTLKYITSLYFLLASKLRTVAVHRFFDSFYSAEAAAQKLNQVWDVLPPRSKVQMVLLSAEDIYSVDIVDKGIIISLGYPVS